MEEISYQYQAHNTMEIKYIIEGKIHSGKFKAMYLNFKIAHLI